MNPGGGAGFEVGWRGPAACERRDRLRPNRRTDWVATECRRRGGDAFGRRLNDVGVAACPPAGDVEALQAADAVVVVAGMEGALPSVVGGLTGAPVVAVPTSTGYGAALEGVTALLSMLASCAAGVTVVGIDNGFGAAAAVLRMLDGSGAASRGTERR